MGCRNQTSRIVVKRSKVAGERATVPPNEDHKSGLWSATDIYKGEMFFNQVDGVLQTRGDDGIEDVSTSSSNGTIMYKARIVQSGTSDPVVTEYINNVGTITASRTAVGNYNFAGFDGLLDESNNLEVSLSVGGRNVGGNAKCFSANPDILVVQSFDNNFDLADDVLNSSSDVARWHTLTIIKY